MNTVKTVEKIKRKLEFWKMLRLTLSGKTLVVKSVILLLLVYSAVIFPPTSDGSRKE